MILPNGHEWRSHPSPNGVDLYICKDCGASVTIDLKTNESVFENGFSAPCGGEDDLEPA